MNLLSQITEKQSFLFNEQALQIMPNEWVKQLHQAGICADEELIFNY